MTDEEYIFHSENREKKRISWGARNTNRSGKGAVRFPSDNLTKKELKAMNGEVKTYNLSRPMTYKEFKKMPENLQREYLDKLMYEFGAPNTTIADMLGVNPHTVCIVKKSLGFNMSKAERRKLNKAAWERFLHGESTETPPEPQKEAQESVEAPQKVDMPKKPWSVQRGELTLVATAAEMAQILAVLTGGQRTKFTVAFEEVAEECI